MNRRVWMNSCASVMASLSLASGQTPSAAMEGASGGGVVTLRSAGQPDRRLQVLKSERMPDGKILNEVKDLATGQVFTIVDTKPFAGTDPKPAGLPVMTPATQAPTTGVAPGTTAPATNLPVTNLPTARPRTVDPLMPGTTVPASAATTARPANRYENSSPPQTEYPTLVGKLRGNTTQPQTQVVSAPANKQSAISQALFGNYADPTTPPSATMVGGNKPTPVTMPMTATTQSGSTGGGIKNALFGTPGQAPAENATLMGKLFGDKPQPVTTGQPTMVAQVPPARTQNIIRPNAIVNGSTRSPAPTVGVPTAPAMPVTEPRMTAVSVSPISMPVTAAVQPASYTPTSSDSRDPNFHVKPAQPMTMKQIEEQVKELRMNQRPSKRMDAATALATGPMANMVEVRQILAEATYRDPVGVVRAHCIDLLAKMKYDEFNYKQYVETLVNDDEPAVQRAARSAVK